MFDQRYSDSAALLADPIPGNDEVFLLVHAEPGMRQFSIHVEDGMPTYVLRPKVLEKYGIRVPLDGEAAKPEGIPWKDGNILSRLSAGCMLWSDEPEPRMLVLRRDEKAPNFPLHYTNPGGRSAESPIITGWKECVEEVCLLVDDRPLIPRIFDPRVKEELTAFKRTQIAGKREALKCTGVDVDKALASEPVVMEEAHLPEDEPLMRDILVYNRGELISRFRALTIWVPEQNVLDLSLVYRLPKGGNLVAIDGEEYNRAVTLESPRYLKGQPVMPHLVHYFTNWGTVAPKAIHE